LRRHHENLMFTFGVRRYAGILLDYEESKNEVNTPEMEDNDDE